MNKTPSKKPSPGFIDKFLHPSEADRSAGAERRALREVPISTEETSGDEVQCSVEAGASSEVQTHRKFDKFNKGN